MGEIISIIFLIIILLLIIYCITLVNRKEHIVNLDDSRKIELKKCCPPGNICYSKPNFITENCSENIIQSRATLEKSYEQAFTNEEYNKILKEKDIRHDIPNAVIDRAIKQEKVQDRENINLVKVIGINTYNEMIRDNTDMVNGYDKDVVYGYNNGKYIILDPKERFV
jgi:hypothetical protein